MQLLALGGRSEVGARASRLDEQKEFSRRAAMSAFACLSKTICSKALGMTNRVPAITAGHAFPENGGLMSYGARMSDLFRRAAGQVDKILKGAKPTELPIEQPTKFELVINLKTAKALGLTIPPVVMMRAEKVIK